MDSRWPFFSVEELQCPCCKVLGMDPQFMEQLVALRRAFTFPMPLSSAYRCPAHNAQVASTGLTGPHTTGRAVDVLVSGPRAWRLVGLAMRYGFTGVGVQQTGPHSGRFVHLDDLSETPERDRPALWSY